MSATYDSITGWTHTCDRCDTKPPTVVVTDLTDTYEAKAHGKVVKPTRIAMCEGCKDAYEYEAAKQGFDYTISPYSNEREQDRETDKGVDAHMQNNTMPRYGW